MADPPTQNTRKEVLTGVPRARKDEVLALHKADPNYISHEITDDNGTTVTIEVVFRVPQDAP